MFKNIILPFILFFLGGILLIIFSFSIDSNLKSFFVETTIDNRQIFTAPENNLGTIIIPFTVKDYLREEIITIKLINVKTKSTVQKVQVSSKLLAYLPDYPFGFPLQQNSKNVNYQILISENRRNASVSVAPGKHYLLKFNLSQTSTDLKKFMAYKISYAVHHPYFLFFVFVSFLPLVIIMVKRLSRFYLVLIIIGLLVRLTMIFGPYNSDVAMFLKDMQIFDEKKNLFLYQPNYNYSPLFYYLLGFLSHVSRFFKINEAYSIKTVIILFELLSVYLINKLAKFLKLNPRRTVLAYYLNPVSIILVAHHAQFDIIAVFFFLLALTINYHQQLLGKKAWFLSTIGLLLKHIIAPQFLIFILRKTKTAAQSIIPVLSSLVLFALSFIPFLPAGKTGILDNVIKYQSIVPEKSLITGTLRTIPGYTIIFFITYCFLCFKLAKSRRSLLQSFLIAALFFLLFSGAGAPQYLILPLIFGVFSFSRGYLIFSSISSLYLLGNPHEMNSYLFRWVTYDFVLLGTLYWLLQEIKYENNKK